MLGTGLNDPILRNDKRDASLHGIDEAVARPVAHPVVLEMLVSLFSVVIPNETHIRLLVRHAFGQGLGAEAEQIEVFGQDNRPVDGGELSDKVRIGDDLFLAGIRRKTLDPLLVIEQKLAGELVLEVYVF